MNNNENEVKFSNTDQMKLLVINSLETVLRDIDSSQPELNANDKFMVVMELTLQLVKFMHANVERPNKKKFLEEFLQLVNTIDFEDLEVVPIH